MIVTLLVVLAIQPPSRELQLASYLPLHTLLEAASIVVCLLVTIISRTTFAGRPSRNMALLGAAFFGVAMLDFMHALSFPGMPALVTDSGTAKAINFWLAARLLAAGALLAAAYAEWERRVEGREPDGWLTGVVAGVAVVGLIILYRPQWLPQTFVPGSGLTWFKIAVELLVVAMSLAAAYGYWQQAAAEASGRRRRNRHDPIALMAACAATALSELCFSLYTDANGVLNLLGHVYKLVAVWFLYRGLVALNLGNVEAQLQLAQQSAGVALFELDISSGRGTWHDEFDRLFGLRPDAPRTFESVLQRVHPDDRDAFIAARAQRLAKGGPFAYEVRTLTEGGAMRWIAMHGEIRQDDQGRPIHMVGAGTDITDRKAAEDAMRQSEARLAGILATSVDAIISVDTGQRITRYNPGAAVMFGWTAEEVIGQPLDVLIPARFRDRHSGHVRGFAGSQAAARLMGERQEIFALRKDGSEFASEASISKFKVGEEWVFTVVLRDVTVRRRQQQELEARVAERTRELRDEIRRREATQAALVQAQRMDALGQLTGGIAHDSNNLLTVITGNLEMIEDELGDHPAQKYVREAQEAAKMGARLNQRLLTFARRRKLEAQVVNLNDQVLAMSELLRRSLGESINLTTVLAHDLWSTRVDPSEIENAVLNLAINARDAMPKGGSLQVSTRNITVDVAMAQANDGLEPGDYVRLTVSDTGGGIPPDVLERVFEPFFTTKGPGRGTGLGLSTIYGFVKQSRGHVTISSEVGRGTTVNVYLPRIAGGDLHPGTAPRGGAVPQAHGEAILVVEDNAQVRALTLERLQRLGYRVREADSGPAALAALERETVDLVFSDVVMPGGMSGFDLAGEVRKRWPGVRVLLTSGYAESTARRQEQAADAARLLRKPYTLAELADAVRAALT